MKRGIIFSFLLAASVCAVAAIKQPVKWTVSASRISEIEARLNFAATISDPWIMYSVNVPEDGPLPISLELAPSEACALNGALHEVTKPKQKHDEMFDMDVKYFKHEAKIEQRLTLTSAAALTVKGTISCQCCSDAECVPIDYDFSVNIAAATPAAAPVAAPAAPTPAKVLTAADSASKQDTAQSAPAAISTPATPAEVSAAPAQPAAGEKSLLQFFLVAVLMGLLGVLTPCVFPMMPMTISFFMRGTSRRKGLVNATVFGLSIIAIYTAIGAIVAITKSADMTNVLSTHWIPNLIFAALFLVFAASFFGAFEITLPSSLANNVDQKADKGGFLSAFFVALSLVIISFACTGPFVGGLIVAAASGAAVLMPLVGMFGFGLGFALPFTVLALFPAAMSKLPKSGGWMNRLKVFFAFILAMFSLKFIAVVDHDLGWHIISREVFLSVWIVLLVLMGAYFLGKLRFALDDEGSAPVSVSRFTISVLSFAAALYLLTGFFGNPLAALSGFLPQQTEIQKTVAIGGAQAASGFAAADLLCDAQPKFSGGDMHGPANMPAYFDLQEALACAKKQGKRVLIDFKGHSCANCKRMEGEVFVSGEVQQALAKNFVIAALYLDDKTPLPEAERYVSTFDGKEKRTLGQKNLDYLMSVFHTNAMPYFVIMDSDGKPLGQPVGYVSKVEEFLKFLAGK